MRGVAGAPERRREEREPGRGQRDADPLAPRHVVPEHAVGEHGDEHEPARDHRLHDRDRRERERRDVEAPRRRRDDAAERVDRRAEQRDRARDAAGCNSTAGAATAPRCLSRKPSTDISAVTNAISRPSCTENGKAGKRTRRGDGCGGLLHCWAMTRTRTLIVALAAIAALTVPARRRRPEAAKPPALRLARRLLRDRLPAERREPGRRHAQRLRLPGARPGAQARLPLQARQLRLRRRDDRRRCWSSTERCAARPRAARATTGGRRSARPSGSLRQPGGSG